MQIAHVVQRIQLAMEMHEGPGKRRKSAGVNPGGPSVTDLS